MSHDTLPRRFAVEISAEDLDGVRTALLTVLGRVCGDEIKKGVENNGEGANYQFSAIYEDKAPPVNEDKGDDA